MTPGGRTRVRYGVIVFLAAVVPHLYALTLPFELDDYHILPNVGRLLDVHELASLDVVGGYAFRPTAWVVWAALISFCGGVASAPLFHAVLLFAHGLTAWLVYRVMRRAVDPRAAAAGAAAFGLMSGGAQAFTWVAAGGDQMAVLFLAMTALCAAARARGAGAWALCGVASTAFLGFLAKETFVAYVPAALLASWLPPRERRRAAAGGVLAAIAVGVAAGLAVRWRVLGFGPLYAYDFSLAPHEALRLHEPLLQMLAPWSLAPEYAAVAPWFGPCAASVTGGDAFTIERVSVAGTIVALLVLGVLVRLSAAPRTLAVLGALGIAILPAMAVWRFDAVPDNTWSRALYGPSAVTAALIACGVAPLLGARPLRIVAWVGLLAFGALQADLTVHFARSELLRARAVEARLDSIGAAARSESPDTLIVAIDPYDGMGGMPLIGPGIAHALKPPFSPSNRAILAWSGAMPPSRAAAYRAHPGPIAFYELQSGRFERTGDRLSAIPDPLPALAAEADARFASTAPIPRRAVRALSIATSPAAVATANITWEFSTGPETTVVPVAAGASFLRALVPDPEDALATRDSLLLAVRVEGVLVPTPPTVVRSFAAIRLVIPPEERLIVLGHKPEIRFEPPAESPIYRITYELSAGGFRIPMIYNVPASRMTPRDSGLRSFVPGALDHVTWPESSHHVTWDDLPAVFRSQPGLANAATVNVMVQGIAAGGAAIESESGWDSLVLLCEK